MNRKNIVIILTACIVGVGIILYAKCTDGCAIAIQNIQEPELEAQVFQQMSPRMFKSLTESRPGVLLDVRTLEEYNEGHLAGAAMIDFYAPDFQDSIASLDRKETYYIYGRSGNRSGKTLRIMRDLGFKDVYGLSGGINGWMGEGYSIEK